VSKYGAKKAKVTIGKETYHFDSKAEKDYFMKLVNRYKKSEISFLKTQPQFVIANAFKIEASGTKSGKRKIGELKYTPDFQYEENATGLKVVVEVKGKKTTDYQMRKKLFLSIAKSIYDIDIFIEVIKGKEEIYKCGTVRT
jgi:hypothetical protein